MTGTIIEVRANDSEQLRRMVSHLLKDVEFTQRGSGAGYVVEPEDMPIVAMHDRCNECQDRPGFNGVGQKCTACDGVGYKVK